MRACGKRSCSGRHRLDLGLAGEHAALELEVVEAVARLRRLGEADDRGRVERRLVAQAQPRVVGAASRAVAEAGLGAIADVEQVAEHRHDVALHAFAEQRGERHAEVLAEQVEERALEAGDGVDRRAQVEGLRAAAAGVAVGEVALHAVERGCAARRSAGRRGLPRRRRSRRRIAAPPGTSPMPVRPAESVTSTRLRVKNGPCAPLRLSSMLSWPATGITRTCGRSAYRGSDRSGSHRTTGGQLLANWAARRRRSRLFARWVRIAARAASPSWPSIASRMLPCSALTRRR